MQCSARVHVRQTDANSARAPFHYADQRMVHDGIGGTKMIELGRIHILEVRTPLRHSAVLTVPSVRSLNAGSLCAGGCAVDSLSPQGAVHCALCATAPGHRRACVALRWAKLL